MTPATIADLLDRMRYALAGFSGNDGFDAEVIQAKAALERMRTDEREDGRG